MKPEDWRLNDGRVVWRTGYDKDEGFNERLARELTGRNPDQHKTFLVSDIHTDGQVFGLDRAADFLFCVVDDTMYLLRLTALDIVDGATWKHFAETPLPESFEEARRWLRVAAVMAS